MLEAETRFRKAESYRSLATLAIKIEQDLLRRLTVSLTTPSRRTSQHALCNRDT